MELFKDLQAVKDKIEKSFELERLTKLPLRAITKSEM